MGFVASETEAPWQESPQLLQGRPSTPAGIGASEFAADRILKVFEPQCKTSLEACLVLGMGPGNVD